MVLDFYEATSTFTLVTTRIFTHPAKRNFVDGLQKTTFPSPPAIQATWLPAFTMTGLSPVRVHCPLLGTLIIKGDPGQSRLNYGFPFSRKWQREAKSLPQAA